MPDAITVALEEGPLNPDAPAADLARRMARITYPEPFTSDQVEQSSAPPDDTQAKERPNPDRSPITR